MNFNQLPEELDVQASSTLLTNHALLGSSPTLVSHRDFPPNSGNHLLPTGDDDMVAQRIEQIRHSVRRKNAVDEQNGKQDNRDSNNRSNRKVGGNSRDTLSAERNEKLFGKRGKDILTALEGRGRNRLSGGGGNDILYGKVKDTLLGGGGRDYLDASQGKRKNRLKGGKGDDELLGSFNDRLVGNNGDDILWAGRGKNRLKGGKGADQFWIVEGDLPRRRNVIKDFEVGKDFLGVAASNEVQSFTDLTLLQQGRDTLIQFNGKDIVLLKRVNATELNRSNILFDPVLIPTEIDATTITTVTLESRAALFQNEVGAFFTDDAEGRIGTLKPGDKGYAAAALSSERRLTVFSSDAPSGSQSQLQLRPNQYLGWYLIQDNNSETFLRKNPNNKIPKKKSNRSNKPLAFFSFADANPDGIDHLQYRSANQLGWEDLTNGGDRSFDDFVFNVDFSFTRREQILPPPPVIDSEPPTQEVGDTVATNVIAGTVFVDENGNGVQDASEVGQAGVTVFLDENRSGFLNAGERFQVTDSTGQYRFEDAPTGSYLLFQEVPVGFSPTAADSFFKERLNRGFKELAKQCVQ